MNISISHYPFRIIIANLLKMEYTMRNSFHFSIKTKSKNVCIPIYHNRNREKNVQTERATEKYVNGT